MAHGVTTPNLPAASAIDSLVGTRQGSTVQIALTRLAALVSALLGPSVETYAALMADLDWPAGSVGYVRGDTEALNGVYLKTGASGAGGWTRIGDLPSGAIEEPRLSALETDAARVAQRLLDLTADIATEAGIREAADAAILAALTSAGQLYETAAAGLTTTVDGDLFVVSGPEGLELYRNDAGAAVALGGFGVSASALLAMGWRPRAADPGHDYCIRVAGTWYAPDPVVITVNAQSNWAQVAASVGGDVTPSRNVWVWDDASGACRILDPAAGPAVAANPVRNYAGLHVGRYIAARLRRPVVIIPYAVSGSAIGAWMSSGAHWPVFTGRVEAAFGAGGLLDGLSTIDVHVVDVVESAHDALIPSLSATVYPAYLAQIRAWARSSEKTRIIAVEAAPQDGGGEAWRANEGWRRLAQSGRESGFYLVSASGLPLADEATDVHFTGPGLVELGHRIGAIVCGDSTGVTSAAQWIAADVTDAIVWREALYKPLASMVFAPTDTHPQSIEVGTVREGTRIVFAINGALHERTVETGSVRATYVLSMAGWATVTVYYPADAVGDDVPSGQYPGIEVTMPGGEGMMRALRVRRDFATRYIYLQGHADLVWSADTAELPSQLIGLRIINCPNVEFGQFRAAEMPLGLTQLSLNGCLIPEETLSEIAAEIAARGMPVNYAAGISAGISPGETFVSLAAMTAAVAAGYARPDGYVVAISDTASAWVRLLQARAGAGAVSGVSPPGWQPVDIDGTGATVAPALSAALARANHTGVQAMSTVTGLPEAMAETLTRSDVAEGVGVTRMWHYPDRAGLIEVQQDPAGATIAVVSADGEAVNGRLRVWARPELWGCVGADHVLTIGADGAPVPVVIAPPAPLLVVTSNASIEIYRHIRDAVWLRWRIDHVVDPAINADVWHTASVWEVERAPTGWVDIMNITHVGSELELAVLIDGKPEHSGGATHGNQLMTGALTLLIDGAAAALGGVYACSSVTLVQQSQLLEPGDTSATKYAPIGPAFVDVSTRWTFEAAPGGIGLVLDHHLSFSASHLLTNGYLAMLPVKRLSNMVGFGGYHVTHTAARSPAYQLEDVSVTGFTEITTSAEHIQIWGDRFGGSVEARSGWLASSRCVIDNRSNYNKVYFDALDGLTTAPGDAYSAQFALAITINPDREIIT